MPDPSQPKRKVPWAAVIIAGAIGFYIAGYLSAKEFNSKNLIGRSFAHWSVAQAYVPAAWVESKVVRKQVVVVVEPGGHGKISAVYVASP